MTDEVVDLSKTLVWTVGMITQAGPDERERVANAYREARDLVAQIPKPTKAHGLVLSLASIARIITALSKI